MSDVTPRGMSLENVGSRETCPTLRLPDFRPTTNLEFWNVSAGTNQPRIRRRGPAARCVLWRGRLVDRLAEAVNAAGRGQGKLLRRA